MRFLFRLLALLLFALACVFAVVDAARTVGAGTFVFTPVEVAWDTLVPGTIALTGQWLSENAHPFLTDTVLAQLLQWPTWAVVTGFAVVFYAIGHRPRRRRGRFAMT
ncbi:MAG: hypothetical protein AAFR13_01795 [Pseudomonadota bacterium]